MATTDVPDVGVLVKGGVAVVAVPHATTSNSANAAPKPESWKDFGLNLLKERTDSPHRITEFVTEDG